MSKPFHLAWFPVLLGAGNWPCAPVSPALCHYHRGCNRGRL